MVDIAVSKPMTAPPCSPGGPLRPTMRLGTASVGPRQWQDDTVKTLKLGTEIAKKSDTDKQYGRSHDPLPMLRDSLVRQSNTVAFGYVREVRVVVVKLRENLMLTNEEIKQLIRSKEATERMLDFIRKDIALNKKSIEIRKQRPRREKEFDEADKILEIERCELDKQKKNLESILKATKKQLIFLDQSRKRLARVLDERNQVLDLLCHSRSSTKHDHMLKSQLAGEPTRPNTTAGIMTPKLHNANVNGDCEVLARTATVAADLQRELTTLDNRPPSDMKRAGVYTARTHRPADGDRPGTPPVSNLGPYTPEAAAAIEECRSLIGSSRELRAVIADTISEAEKEEKRMHVNVNDALTQRLAETVTLMQHLNMGEAENRSAFNRSLRHYEKTDVSRGYTLGPVAYGDFRTAERLDRPHMKVYQRHPGTNAPDARDLIRANNNCEASLEQTQKNLALLHLSKLRLKEDQRDKKAAADVDAAIIRLRRQKADHRWVSHE